ncbi:unnamed protein product [Alopecurus aequalis]
MGPPREVVEISSDDDDEAGSGKWSVSPGTLGWIARIDDSLAPVPRKKKGKGAGVRVGDDVDDDDDCVVLDGDPHRPVAVAGAKERSEGVGTVDEVEIVAVKGEIACKDFPHSRHVCSEFPFGSTSHLKHCSMCYCFVCDAPAPCMCWGKGLLNEDHCHATDKETKWKTLRASIQVQNSPAPNPEKHTNARRPEGNAMDGDNIGE